METVNRMHWGASGIYKTPAYWEHVDRIIHMADELGLYMALLPSWGSLLKTGVITEDNILEYGSFLAMSSRLILIIIQAETCGG